MLRFMRRSSRWVMWIVIIAVVAVGDRSYDTRDVLRVRQSQEAQLRQNLGDAFDPDAASDYLDQSAASMLLRQALLAREAERMGLTVSDAEIRGYLRELPGAADEEGRLQREVITAYAERNFGSLRRFQEALRDELLAAKASRRIQEAAAVSDAEVRTLLRQERTEVRIAAVVLDAERLRSEVEVPEEAVEAFLTEQPERVREAYEARSAEFDRPEQVRARHILVKVPQGAPEEEVEAARERIGEIRERIAGGADFADVALEVSQDHRSSFRAKRNNASMVDLGPMSRKQRAICRRASGLLSRWSASSRSGTALASPSG